MRAGRDGTAWGCSNDVGGVAVAACPGIVGCYLRGCCRALCHGWLRGVGSSGLDRRVDRAVE
jgi:hypothetical protein